MVLVSVGVVKGKIAVGAVKSAKPNRSLSVFSQPQVVLDHLFTSYVFTFRLGCWKSEFR